MKQALARSFLALKLPNIQLFLIETMQTLAPPSWELFNPFYQGFFRVQYHPDLWQIVLDKLDSNQFEASVAHRVYVNN